MSTTLIQNGRIVTAADEFVADLLIVDGKIGQIGQQIDPQTAETVIDASGLYVLPGGVDVHTHLDQGVGEGRSADDFYTGQRAAAFGGTTTHIDFAIQEKGESLTATVQRWHQKAADKAVIDYGYHVAIADLNEGVLEEIGSLPEMGVTSIKLFMAYKETIQVDDMTLFQCLQQAQKHGLLTLVHAENGDAIEVLIAQAQAAGQTEPIYHALTRPPEVEAEATARAIRLAQVADNAPLFVVHCSCEAALEEIKRARMRGQNVWAETCTHYLFFTKDDLQATPFDAFGGAKYVCSPPLRTGRDQTVLWQALKTGELHSVSTDHCSWSYSKHKILGRDDFAQIPNGVPGIEERLMMLWGAGVRSGRITPSQFVALTATNPAQMFGLYPQKGSLMVGSDADVVLWDGEQDVEISAATHHSAMDYNLYEGMMVRGRPVKVWVRGQLVVDGDTWLGEAGSGRFMARKRPTV